LKELSTQHPVFFAFFSAEALEIPWGEQKETNSRMLGIKFHICMSWELECLSGALFVCEHRKTEFGELSVILERYLASPKRVSGLTEGSVLLIECFNK